MSLVTATFVRAGLLLSVLSSAACNESTGPPALPQVIHECETNTAPVCGTWTLQTDRTYRAQWTQGSAAAIRVEKFATDSVVFVREDLPGTTTPTMRARYRGAPVGRAVTGGVVEWTLGPQTFSGSWTASW